MNGSLILPRTSRQRSRTWSSSSRMACWNWKAKCCRSMRSLPTQQMADGKCPAVLGRHFLLEVPQVKSILHPAQKTTSLSQSIANVILSLGRRSINPPAHGYNGPSTNWPHWISAGYIWLYIGLASAHCWLPTFDRPSPQRRPCMSCRHRLNSFCRPFEPHRCGSMA